MGEKRDYSLYRIPGIVISGEHHGGYSDIFVNKEGKVFVIWEDYIAEESAMGIYLSDFSFTDEFVK